MSKTLDEILNGKMSEADKVIYKEQMEKVNNGEITASEALKNIRAAGVTFTANLPQGTPRTETR